MDTDDPVLTFKPSDAAWIVASYMWLVQNDRLSDDEQATLAPYVERLQAQIPMDLFETTIGKPPIERVA